MTGGRPGRRCTICGHSHRTAIDAQLIAGHAQADIADQHRISRDALSRHFLRHVRAIDAPELADVPGGGPVDLLATADGLKDRLMRLLRRAELAKDHRTALLAIREARGLLELRGRLTGEIDAGGTKIAVLNAADPGNTAAARQRVLGKLLALAGGGLAAD